MNKLTLCWKHIHHRALKSTRIFCRLLRATTDLPPLLISLPLHKDLHFGPFRWPNTVPEALPCAFRITTTFGGSFRPDSIFSTGEPVLNHVLPYGSPNPGVSTPTRTRTLHRFTRSLHTKQQLVIIISREHFLIRVLVSNNNAKFNS